MKLDMEKNVNEVDRPKYNKNKLALTFCAGTITCCIAVQ